MDAHFCQAFNRDFEKVKIAAIHSDFKMKRYGFCP